MEDWEALDDEISGQAEVIKGLAERVDIALSLLLLVVMAFFRIEMVMFEGVGLLYRVSSGWGA